MSKPIRMCSTANYWWAWLRMCWGLPLRVWQGLAALVDTRPLLWFLMPLMYTEQTDQVKLIMHIGFFHLFHDIVSWTQLFKDNCRFALNPFVSLISFLVACVARIAGDKQTDRQTYNPSTVTLGCACAPRVNKERGIVTMFHHNFYNVSKDKFILSDVATHTVMFWFDIHVWVEDGGWRVTSGFLSILCG